MITARMKRFGLAAAIAATAVVGLDTASASAAPNCATLHRHSMRAALAMEIAMEEGNFPAWNNAYDYWLATETLIESSGC